MTEPDYRFSLANERTYLAWVRTGLGLLAAGIGIAQFVPDVGFAGSSHAAGAAVGLLAIVLLLRSANRWRAVDTAIRNGAPLPQFVLPRYLSIALAAIGIAVIGSIIASI